MPFGKIKEDKELMSLGQRLARGMNEMFRKTAIEGVLVDFHLGSLVGPNKKYQQLVFEVRISSQVHLQSVKDALETYVLQRGKLPKSTVVHFVYWR